MDEATKHCQVHLPPLITLSQCQHWPYLSSEFCLWLLYQMHQEEPTGHRRHQRGRTCTVLVTPFIPCHSLTCSVVLPSPPHPSHVVCHVVFLHGVLVKAVRDVLQFLLLQTTNEAACLHANQSRAREGGGRREEKHSEGMACTHVQLSEVAQCKSHLHVFLQGFLLVSQLTK